MRQQHSSSIQFDFLFGSSHELNAANDALIECGCCQKFYWQKMTRIDFTVKIPIEDQMATQANSISKNFWILIFLSSIFVISKFLHSTVVNTVSKPKSKICITSKHRLEQSNKGENFSPINVLKSCSKSIVVNKKKFSLRQTKFLLQ